MGTTDRPPIDGPQQWDQALLAGLVGPHRQRYLTSPSFKHSIDHLRAMLPAMVSGLAAAADQSDAMARMYSQALVAGEVNIDDLLRQIQEDADGTGPAPS